MVESDQLNFDTKKCVAKNLVPKLMGENWSGAGFAVYQVDKNHTSFNLIHSNSYKLPPYATVFQAEVEAINQGARFALDIN